MSGEDIHSQAPPPPPCRLRGGWKLGVVEGYYWVAGRTFYTQMEVVHVLGWAWLKLRCLTFSQKYAGFISHIHLGRSPWHLERWGMWASTKKHNKKKEEGDLMHLLSNSKQISVFFSHPLIRKCSLVLTQLLSSQLPCSSCRSLQYSRYWHDWTLAVAPTCSNDVWNT